MAVPMTLPDPRYEDVRRALESARAALTSHVADAESGPDERGVGTLGETEHLVEGEQREIDSIVSALQRTSLRDIDAALDRMAQGTFGRCVVCGDEIPFERLEAMPAAANCVRCQGAAERSS